MSDIAAVAVGAQVASYRGRAHVQRACVVQRQVAARGHCAQCQSIGVCQRHVRATGVDRAIEVITCRGQRNIATSRQVRRASADGQRARCLRDVAGRGLQTQAGYLNSTAQVEVLGRLGVKLARRAHIAQGHTASRFEGNVAPRSVVDTCKAGHATPVVGTQ